MTGTVTTAWPLLGRDVELALLADAIDDPAAHGVAVLGQAGLGKSRLAAEALGLAEERGRTAMAVRATPSASSVPLAALAPLLASFGLGGDVTAGLLADALAEARRRFGAEPMVLVVDDAQQLDDASVTLLDHLSAEGSVFVVLTARVQARQVVALRNLWRDERMVRIELQPLPDDAVRSLTAMALGGPVEETALQTLLSASAGNVLYLRELILAAVESGALGQRQGIWRLTGPLGASRRLLDLIGDRLSDLSREERHALELVALGEPLELSLLTALVPLDAVEALEERGVLDSEFAEDGPRLRFDHPLFGEVARAWLTPARRAAASRSLADAAEAHGGHRLGDVLRVAVWRLEGGGRARLDTTMTAARQAFNIEDFHLCARLARAGWEEWGELEAALLLADALDLSGRTTELAEVLDEAARRVRADQQRANVAARTSALRYRLGDGQAADTVLREAARTVTDPTARRILESQRTTNLLLGGDVGAVIPRARAVLAEEAHAGDTSAAQASRDLATALALAGRTDEAVQRADEALSIRVEQIDAGELMARATFGVALALALGEAGRLEEAARTADFGYQLAVEHRNVDGQAWFASVLGLVRCAEGRLATAAKLYREVTLWFEQLHHEGRRWGLGGLALAAGQMGDGATAAAAVAELDRLAPTSLLLMDVTIGRGRAWAAAASGDRKAARAELWRMESLGRGWGQWGPTSAVLHDLLRLGDVSAAEPLADVARRVDGALVLGRLHYGQAVADGDPDAAAAASSDFEGCGALLFAAEGAELERRLAERRGLAARAEAARRRVGALLGRCEGADTPALPRDDGRRLSRREREVALLAARGLSSRQIADHLFLSVRTVDNHLQRSYVKLGVTNRQALAEALAVPAGPG